MASSASVVRFAGRRSCGECQRSQYCVWQQLDGLGLRELAEFEISARLYRRGDHLFRAGDDFKALYVVRSGAIKTYMDSEDGEEQIIGFHMPGDIIGFNGIAARRHVCNAAALDTSSACIFPFDKLARLCSRSPQMQTQLINWMSRTILRDEDMLLTLGKKNAEQRMAAFLLSQSGHQSERGFSATEFTLAMSRTDISNYLGLAVETISRILTRFQTAGVLSVHRNQVRILDLDALQTFANAAENASPESRIGAIH
jgi:CRP/FNR family transcriptional regulator